MDELPFRLELHPSPGRRTGLTLRVSMPTPSKLTGHPDGWPFCKSLKSVPRTVSEPVKNDRRAASDEHVRVGQGAMLLPCCSIGFCSLRLRVSLSISERSPE